MSEIRMLKLVSGEELVCSVVDSDDTGMKIENPVIYMALGNAVATQKWMFPFVTQTEFFIPKEYIMLVVSPQEEVIENYRERFGSGLALPPQKGLLLPK